MPEFEFTVAQAAVPIKLENILLTDEGTVKLTDLGLLKRLDGDNGLTKTGILLGTAQYMPPEYVKAGIYDERSDLYAVGLVLYEILAGERRPESVDARPARRFAIERAIDSRNA